MARVVDEPALRAAVPLDLAAVDVVEGAFRALAGGDVVMPPILSMALTAKNGEVDVKTAWIPALPRFAVKISPGFFDNPGRGLPSTSGLMVVLSAETGRPEAVLLDQGYLTDIRTAAAGAVAARHLARADAATACIIGAGVQARLQLRALVLVRPIRRAAIWARDPDRAARTACDLAESTGIDVAAASDPAAAVAAADIVVTTTPATRPILMAEWLRPGQHVTAMGSDQAHKGELDPACLTRADRYVPDRLSQARELGELRAAVAAGALPTDAAPAELGAVIVGDAPGRRRATDITIADLTGTGAQDTAIAHHALARIGAG